MLKRGINVFISYARSDGVQLAQRLHQDLSSEGFDVWLDTQGVASGKSWTEAVERAIDGCQVALALLTPGSYVSEICRAEQLRALRKGKRVIPLLGRLDAERPLHLEARQYRDFTEDSCYARRFEELLGDISSGAGVTLEEMYRVTRITYVTAPPFIANYVDRPEAVKSLRDALFAERGRVPVALTAVAGMGGIGKTVLAQALVRDEVVRQAFPDGIVWLTVGKGSKHNVVTAMREVAKALGDDLSWYEDELGCVNRYRTLIARRSALIVLDDVWTTKDIQPFLAESPCSRVLFTTRDSSVATFTGAHEYRAELLDLEHSRELLAAWAGLHCNCLPALADDVIRECGRLPLAISIVGALLRGANNRQWEDVLKLLRRPDLSAVQEQLPRGQESFYRAVELSVNALTPKMRQRYRALAVLLEDMQVPLPILATLWNVSESEARRTSKHLADRSLANRDVTDDSIVLHDLQLDYLHGLYKDREALELIHGALRVSWNVIESDPGQFTSQMVGRLLCHEERPSIREFTTSLKRATRRPWLRPLRPTLHSPGASLLQRSEDHSGPVHSVAASLGRRRAVSASYDATLKVWDLETLSEVCTLRGHMLSVWGAAITPDGRQVVSASDNVLKVWDVETGSVLRTLRGHSNWVYSVALTPSGRRAVSGSRDDTLRVWDLRTGRSLRILTGHSDTIYGVAVSQNGRLAVSASRDQTLKMWDLRTGRTVRTLRGHAFHVVAVAITPDGRLAISSSVDNTLMVWDLKAGRAIRTLKGHSDSVDGVAVSPDGRWVVSASLDWTLKLWDLNTGEAVATFTCDSATQCCAFAGDRVILAGDDTGAVHFLSIELGDWSASARFDSLR
ncbi:MAG: NB-ARC domain-containing protein [Bryobacteraceae bacterium]